MASYGCDKPDLRFGMKIQNLTDLLQKTEFKVFSEAEYIGGLVVAQGASFTRKELDSLVEFVKRPQVGGTGIVNVKVQDDGTYKSSADKFLGQETLAAVAQHAGANQGDLLLIMAGKRSQTLTALGALRLELARRLNLLDPKVFKPLWVVDFPLLEWDEETQRFYAMHHPFTAPKPEDIPLFETNPGAMRADAYDLVLNGNEVGGGSIRIHDSAIQRRMFKALGFSDEAAQAQFGFLLNAFRYGAPPHGGIAFGFDRLCALFGGSDSIRDYIAFPKNNAARDVMIDSPSTIDATQLEELGIAIAKPKGGVE